MLNRNQLLELRKKYLSPSLSLSYDKPLHIVRAKGQFLYDSKGDRYLDAVNNIQHVGHCHPKVVSAASEQYGILNTNTRYLDETVINYAKDLTNYLPNGLTTCFFTNSGSESNDLALRLARTATDSKETIVLDGAYHGHVSSLIDISPYKHNSKGGSGPPSYVHTLPMPDSYRGKYRGDEALTGYIDELKNILYSIKKNGKNISAFVVESIMGCGGQLILPDGFLERAFELVREEGGVCIADEVQIGFGRVGSKFWGFETANVQPDIVTMGKSMGNGHPLSVVVTKKQIADKFNNGMEYFNSFGGNPVSCAVGKAVLNVIEDEKLQQNAHKVGEYLLEKLKQIQGEFPLIGQVRGMGLFIGIELIKEKSKLIPAHAEAEKVVNEMMRKRILLSTDGPDHNVIKIKPPMVFSTENADELVLNLSEVLGNM
tara:strand:- start:2216 stop:3502 length:1287 start_codon:yes stop_codon:yes gene_type:complete